MHDPMVVAFEIRRPWPQKSSVGGRSSKRWEVKIRGGKWWRPGAWSPFVRAFGRSWYFPAMVTVWHVEPGGRDSGEVCKHWVDGKPKRSWRWHVHHWKIQVALVQKLHRKLFERCQECGRGYPWGYAPISHQWDRTKPKHWWKIDRGAYHHECSSLVTLRRTVETDVDAFRELVSMARLFEDVSEDEWVNRYLWGAPVRRGPGSNDDFAMRRRVWLALGYEYDDAAGRLVKKATERATKAVVDAG
jgi:hypothetical protein